MITETLLSEVVTKFQLKFSYNYVYLSTLFLTSSGFMDATGAKFGDLSKVFWDCV